MDAFALPEFAGEDDGGFVVKAVLLPNLSPLGLMVPNGGEGIGLHPIIDHPIEAGAQTQPGPLPLQHEVAAGGKPRHRDGRAGPGPLPFPQGLIEVVHVEDDGDLPAEAARQRQGQERPVVDVQQVRPESMDDPGYLPVVEGKIIPVAAVEPPAPALQGNAVILRPAPGFLARQVGVRHPDDHRPPVGEMVRHLFDEQLRRPAPDGRDGKEFGADQGYGGHGRRP